VPQGARWLVIGYGGALWLWFSTEDQTALWVTLFGTLGAVLVVGAWASGRTVPRAWWLVWGALLGATVGAGAVWLTTFFMFFKTAWHSHLFPDFPIPMMIAMLERLPLWSLAGAFIGAGLALWRLRP
jgi:prepilin signal peptidase PulO-like enzyme (type II secretory pathway)